jgi:hypothetical protein
VTQHEDQVERDHEQQPEDRSLRYALPADQVVLVGRIEDFDPSRRRPNVETRTVNDDALIDTLTNDPAADAERIRRYLEGA